MTSNVGSEMQKDAGDIGGEVVWVVSSMCLVLDY